MEIELHFIGRATQLVEFYEAGGETEFPVVPNIGDHVRLRMHPGPDIRTFRCTGRLFDFSEAGRSVLQLQLDMP